MKKIFSKLAMGMVVILAGYGLVLAAGFFGVKYGLTNVSGQVDEKNEEFEIAAKESLVFEKTEEEKDVLKKEEFREEIKKQNQCKISSIAESYPTNAQKISQVYAQTDCDSLVSKMILAVRLRKMEDAQFEKKIVECENKTEETPIARVLGESSFVLATNVFPWANETEWQVIREAVVKDKEKIDRAATAAKIESRLIVAAMIVEQLRLFHSEREVFEKFFQPLKILCSANKISLGVMGIKEATAIKVENNLKDKTSPFYLGLEEENLLNFQTADVTKERYDRLVDDKNHYYSYLYGALYLKQMMTQWKGAGFNIDYRPEIIGTLFNVGFPQSRPNPAPKVGGSQIEVSDGKYSFGSLAYEFYYSGELLEEFPYVVD